MGAANLIHVVRQGDGSGEPALLPASWNAKTPASITGQRPLAVMRPRTQGVILAGSQSGDRYQARRPGVRQEITMERSGRRDAGFSLARAPVVPHAAAGHSGEEMPGASCPRCLTHGGTEPARTAGRSWRNA